MIANKFPSFSVFSRLSTRRMSSETSQNTMLPGSKSGMDWATKAFMALLLTCGVSYGWYKHDEYYSSRGMVHPITALITKNLYTEVKDREKRIQSTDYHSARALERSRENPSSWAWVRENDTRKQ